MEIDPALFAQQRRPKFGNANPERMLQAFWEWMVRGDDSEPTKQDGGPPLYKMLEQFAGAGASIRRFALFGSYGTSWTAMVDAATEPSFRMMCSWSRPGSTSVGAGCPGTNVYTWGVQSSSYSVMVPDVTMIRLWPGCVCQPVLATTPVVGLTGGQTLLCTYTSDGP